MTTYDWDLIERLLHEVQNGADQPFTPRPYAEAHAQAKAAQGEAVDDVDALKARACDYEEQLVTRGFIERRPASEGGNGENFVLTERGARLLSLIDSSIPGFEHPRQVLNEQVDALDASTFEEAASKAQIAGGPVN